MASDSASSMSTTKTLISSIASFAATAMLARTIYKDFLPDEFTNYIYGKLRHYLDRFSHQMTMVIDEYNGLVANEIYEAAVIYLGTKASSTNRRLNISKPQKENSIAVAVDRNDQLDDEFDGAKIKWVWMSQQVQNSSDSSKRRSEIRSFELRFHDKYKKKVLESYLPYVLKEAQTAKNLSKSVQIFTIDPYKLEYEEMSEAWIPVHLDHPSNFETLAMDSDLKNTIVKDLDRFVSRREFYRNVGKAWKRGYLLYGPPGTGKSSLIAAMANHLKFDVYDLELTAIRNNNLLRRLLLLTANRSILVVEDIDCTMQLHDRAGNEEEEETANKNQESSKVTLSGFLNFVDGLWSGCGDERIIIFTTNHKEKLDPALLRPGRMDMHIHMSYCTPSGFRTLARNYLHIDDHKLFGDIVEMIKSIEVTPAEMAEQLLECEENDVDVALSGILSFLHEKKKIEEEETMFLEKQELDIEEDNQNIEDTKTL